MANVRVIQRKGHAVLVEWYDGRLHRGRVPAEKVASAPGIDRVDERDLTMAMPHGLPWAELIELKGTPEAVEERLHEVGIWTAEDLDANPQAAVGAFLAVYQMDVSALRAAVKNYEKGR